MPDPSQPKHRITRRSLAKLAFASAVIVPVARGVSLKMKDNPLPEVALPALILEGGWVLDARDSDNFRAASR